MLNQQKVAHLIGLINQSKILTDNEKSDWLGLVELMNDKQLGELEDILINTKASAVSGPDLGTKPKSDKPDLSAETGPTLPHISNLPVGLAQPPKPVKPTASGAEDFNTPSNLRSAFVQSGQRLTQPITQVSKPTASEKPKPAELKPSESSPITRAPIGRMAIQEKESTVANNTNSSQATSVPKAVSEVPSSSGNGSQQSEKQQQSQQIEPQKLVEKTPAEINDLSDINELTFQKFRSYHYESTLKAVQNLVLRLGYFAVIVALENSPAYRTYLNTGKMLLGDSSQDSSQMFSKLEFEEFTDLLLDMRVNVN